MTAVPKAWAHLPFFDCDWPRISRALAADPRPVLPPEPLRFAALDRCAPDQIRVVILGQDPYHTPGKADGLAFSINPDFGGRLDSLGNIFKELQDDLGVTRHRTDLSDWADQGVLLLNTALSVPPGMAKGHDRLGWQALIGQVLAELDASPRAFLLWGAPAQQLGGRYLTNPGHLRIETAHPSPLSAWRGFLGSRPFSRTNDWLTAQGHPPIRWG